MNLNFIIFIFSGRNLRIGTNLVTSNLAIEKELKTYEVQMIDILRSTIANRIVNSVIRSVSIGTAVKIKASRLRNAPLIGNAIAHTYHLS